MSDYLHCAIHGNPVGMHIEEAHEDAHHDATVMEIFIFLHLFHHHYLTIGRSHHHAIRLAREQTYGTLEEIEQNSIEDYAQEEQDLEEQTHRKQQVNQTIKCKESTQCPHQRVCTLVMQSDFLEFLQSFTHLFSFTYFKAKVFFFFISTKSWFHFCASTAPLRRKSGGNKMYFGRNMLPLCRNTM